MLIFKDLFLPDAASDDGHHTVASPTDSVPRYGAATAASRFPAGLGNAAESDRWFGPRQEPHPAVEPTAEGTTRRFRRPAEPYAAC